MEVEKHRGRAKTQAAAVADFEEDKSHGDFPPQGKEDESTRVQAVSNTQDATVQERGRAVWCPEHGCRSSPLAGPCGLGSVLAGARGIHGRCDVLGASVES